jgi:hypothetical protein
MVSNIMAGRASEKWLDELLPSAIAAIIAGLMMPPTAGTHEDRQLGRVLINDVRNIRFQESAIARKNSAFHLRPRGFHREQRPII